MGAIDIGTPAIYQGAGGAATFTNINLGNPANLKGKITSVEVWALTDLTGFRVGIFYLVSGVTYKCRSSATIGNVTSGSKQTFPVSLVVEIGDFIGAYWASGAIERGDSGGSRAYVAGEYLDPDDQAAYTVDARLLSLYGAGATPVKSSLIPRLIAMGQI